MPIQPSLGFVGYKIGYKVSYFSCNCFLLFQLVLVSKPKVIGYPLTYVLFIQGCKIFMEKHGVSPLSSPLICYKWELKNPVFLGRKT